MELIQEIRQRLELTKDLGKPKQTKLSATDCIMTSLDAIIYTDLSETKTAIDYVLRTFS